MERPTIETARLILRPFAMTDAPEVARLAGDRAIAATTVRIPYPYELADAQAWISGHAPAHACGSNVVFAITRRTDAALLGAIGLEIDRANSRAELGYWIGKPYWGHGYATESAAPVVRYGFTVLNLNRIHAGYFSGNPASGRVLEKIGMVHEGRRRQHWLKWGTFHDSQLMAILRQDFFKTAGPA